MISYQYCFFAALFFLTCFFPQTALSQQQSDTLSGVLPEIEVKAVHSSIAADDITLPLTTKKRPVTELYGNLPLSLDNITSNLPGIWVNDRENYALGERVTIRGMGWRASFGVRGIQVIMDDIPLTVADGQTMLNSIDPSFIQRMELIRGPASTFWGNSSGGVLYLSTISPVHSNSNFTLRSSMGSYGTQKQEVRFSKSSGNHKFSGYSSYLSSNGYREHSATKISRTGFKGGMDISSTGRVEYMGAFVAMPEAEHPSSLTEEQALQDPRQANSSFQDINAGKNVYQGQLGINYYKQSSLGFLTLTGYGIYRDLDNPLPFAIITLDRWAGGLRGTVEKSFKSLTINAGFDTKFQHDDREEFDNENSSPGSIQVDQTEKVRNQALFLTSNLTLGSFGILGGVRFDRLTFSTDARVNSNSGKRTFHALNPSLGFTYRLDNMNIYSNLSTSFEAPTTTELVNSPDQQEGFNPVLSEEKTLGLDIGTKGHLNDRSISYDLAFYQLWIRDLLFPFQLEEDGPVFFRNQGKTRHRGIEGSISANFRDRYNIDLNYNYTDAIFKEGESLDNNSLTGNRVPGIPGHRLYISAAYSPIDWLVKTTYQYVSGYPTDNTNTASNDSYGTVDLTISRRFHFEKSAAAFQPFLTIRNLINSRYNGSVVINAFGGRYFEPAAGRNFQIGLSLHL